MSVVACVAFVLWMGVRFISGSCVKDVMQLCRSNPGVELHNTPLVTEK